MRAAAATRRRHATPPHSARTHPCVRPPPPPPPAPQELIATFRGVDPDKPQQRRAVARFVGLEMPADVPLAARTPDDVVDAYASRLTDRTADISKLVGLDNMKAQYYGVNAVAPNPLDARKARAAAADGTGGGGGGGGDSGAAAPA